jgi:S1-C subfamily serine protease
LAAGLLVVVLVVAGAVAWRSGRDEAPSATAPAAAAVPTPVQLAPGSAGETGISAPATPGAPTVAELLRQALPATAVVACQGQSGTGFFVEAELLVTNAHVSCGDKVPLEITLGDGRQLIGTIGQKDAWLDWALVKVPGANVLRPLIIGDSTTLAAGDPIGLIGAPRGLASTVHEGKVSFVGRNIRGIAFLQLSAAVNPGNSGGPLLDGLGRVVGIVSLKVNESDGLGMALPVEYLRPAVPRDQPHDEAAARRWAVIRARAEAEDAEEITRLRKDLAQPVLVSVASSGPRSLELTVMQRWAGRPGTASLTVEVQREGKVLCRPTGRVEAWVDLAARQKKAPAPPSDGKSSWLLRHDLLAGVHGGSADVGLGRCPDPLPEGSRLRLEWAEGERGWFRVPDAAPTTERERELWRAREGADARRLQDEQERRTTEEAWRKAFKTARQQVAEAERRCERFRKEVAQPHDMRSEQWARQQLPEAEQQLQAARDHLDDLERAASRQGIPREWR